MPSHPLKSALPAMLLLAAAVRISPAQTESDRMLRFRPYAGVSGTYDSNVRLVQEGVETNTQDGIYSELTAGTAVDADAGPLEVTVDLGGTIRRYLDSDQGDLDHEGVDAGLALDWTRASKVRPRLGLSYDRVVDYIRQPRVQTDTEGPRAPLVVSGDRAARTDRVLWRADVGLLVPLTDKSDADVAYALDSTEYEDPTLFDTTEHSVSLELSSKLTAKNSVFVSWEAGEQDSSGFPEDGRFHIVQLGWKTRVTGKTDFRGGAGIELYDAPAIEPEGESNDEQNLSFTAAGDWRPAVDVRLQLLADRRTDLSPFESGNTREVTYFTLTAARAFHGVSVSAGVSYRMEDYRRFTGGADDVEPRELDAYGGRIGIQYTPPEKHYSLYTNASYEDTSSNQPEEDYDQARVSIGARFAL